MLLGCVALTAGIAVVIGMVTWLITSMMRDRKPGSSGSLGSAMLEVHGILEPSKRTMLEVRRQAEESEEHDESGEPPH